MGDIHSIIGTFVQKSEVKMMSFSCCTWRSLHWYSQKPHIKDIQLYPDRVDAFALAEIALLVSLTSADKGVAQLAAQSLRAIAQAERQSDAPINHAMSQEERSRRHPVYEKMGDPSIVVFGKFIECSLTEQQTEFSQDVSNNKSVSGSFCAP
jgi:hypothetical protein